MRSISFDFGLDIRKPPYSSLRAFYCTPHYIPIEFQTTDSGKKDLRRFQAYEGVFSHKTGKNVITYVIYSGGIKRAVTEMDCGIHTYRVDTSISVGQRCRYRSETSAGKETKG